MRKKMISLVQEQFGDTYVDEYEYLLGDYVLKEWNFGEREEVIEMASVQKLNPKTQEITVQIKSSKFRVLTIHACLKEAPFKISVNAIKELPVFVAEYLFDEINKLNEPMSEDQQKKFRSS